jgi:hypothetical protein
MFGRRKDTLYDILGCSPYATPAEISAAYKHTAFLIHPDLSAKLDLTPAEWEKRLAWTKELNRAWEVLKSPERRGEYNQQIGLRPESRAFKKIKTWQKNLFTPLREIKHDPPRFNWTKFRLERPRLSSRLLNELYGSRGGQWLLLLMFAGLVQVIGDLLGTLNLLQFTLIRGPVEIGALLAVALILARAGEPSPMFDALDLMIWLDHRVWSLTKNLFARAAGQTSEILATSAQTAAEQVREAHRRAQLEDQQRASAPPFVPPGRPSSPSEERGEFPESKDFVPPLKRPGARPRPPS